MPDKFSAARWLAPAVYFAGLVFIFITNNTRWWTLFCLVASLLFCFDLFVLTPRPKLSLLNARDDAKPKFQRSGLMWVAFALILIGCLDTRHVRASASLIMSGLCLAIVDHYRSTRANSVARR
jgi:hypothetical protein